MAAGLALRHDGGSGFRAAHYQAEIDYLPIIRSPAYHYEPVWPSGYRCRKWDTRAGVIELEIPTSAW